MSKKQYAFTLIVLLVGVGVGVLLGWFGHAGQRYYKDLDALNQSLRETIYGNLETTSQELKLYCDTEEKAHLDAARTSLNAAMIGIEACGDYLGYRADYDNTDDIIQQTAIRFLASANVKLWSGPPAQTVKDIADVIRPVDGEKRVTFIGIYFNLGHSPYTADGKVH